MKFNLLENTKLKIIIIILLMITIFCLVFLNQIKLQYKILFYSNNKLITEIFYLNSTNNLVVKDIKIINDNDFSKIIVAEIEISKNEINSLLSNYEKSPKIVKYENAFKRLIEVYNINKKAFDYSLFSFSSKKFLYSYVQGSTYIIVNKSFNDKINIYLYISKLGFG